MAKRLRARDGPEPQRAIQGWTGLSMLTRRDFSAPPPPVGREEGGPRKPPRSSARGTISGSAPSRPGRGIRRGRARPGGASASG
ncbi:MAG: hypothetical protein M0C28_40015 [Candidatus Moduliflexus flocculans]|nr:hypothetical protein [Candidatus Moduliflexus flocculans]